VAGDAFVMQGEVQAAVVIRDHGGDLVARDVRQWDGGPRLAGVFTDNEFEGAGLAMTDTVGKEPLVIDDDDLAIEAAEGGAVIGIVIDDAPQMAERGRRSRRRR
jgi:hypothetical protein